MSATVIYRDYGSPELNERVLAARDALPPDVGNHLPAGRSRLVYREGYAASKLTAVKEPTTMCEGPMIDVPTKYAALRALGFSSGCDCEVCTAGGSCIEGPPFATTIDELVERLPWHNIAVALKALGLKVEFTEEMLDRYARMGAEAEADAERRFLIDECGLDESEVKEIDIDEPVHPVADLRRAFDDAVAELRAAGASRHQIYRLAKKAEEDYDAIGKDDFALWLAAKVAAVKARIRNLREPAEFPDDDLEPGLLAA
jgi:hypothetical protein